jgi:hypothetical protein
MKMYLHRLVSDLWHEQIQARLKALKVSYDLGRNIPNSKWLVYRVSLEECKKLPDDDGPYLPIDDIQGYGLYTDPHCEVEVANAGGWTHVSN